METLDLFSPYASSRTTAEPQPGECADGAPRFLLIPRPRLPARRLLQGLAAEVSLLIVALLSGWLFGTNTVPDITLGAGPHAEPIRIWLYDPPATKKPPNVPVPRVMKAEGLKAFELPQPLPAVAAPVVGPPPAIVNAPIDIVPQLPDKGLPLPPITVLAALQVKKGTANAPAAPIVGMAPGPARAAAFPKQGANGGRDLLGAAGQVGRIAGQGNGIAGSGGGPPDLSAKQLQIVDGGRARHGSGFQKPVILFMPKPKYPAAALAEGVEGNVSLEVTFDKTGHVIFRRFVQVLPNAELNAAARETIDRIQFVPAKRDDDVPIDQDSIVTVFFRLTHLDMTAGFQEE